MVVLLSEEKAIQYPLPYSAGPATAVLLLLSQTLPG